MTRLILFVALLLAPALCATVSELRITEVRPLTDTVEVTHIGAAGFTQAADAFFRFGSSSQAIALGTAWTAGEVKQFTVTGLPDTISDLWIYLDNQFTLSSSIIHGVKYGGSALSGNETVAVAAAIWPSAASFSPAPGAGQTLSYDGVGFTPQDWFVDSTPSLGAFPDNATGAAVATTFGWPSGSQTFETVSAGDTLTSLTNWVFVDTSAVPNTYTVRAAADTYSGTGIRPTTTARWLRVNDADAANVQNRFYSPTVTAPSDPSTYSWTWYVNIEQPLVSGLAQYPRMVIQHFDGAMTNAWGVEFTNAFISLVVESPTGAATASATAVDAALFNQWVKLTLAVNFGTNVVSLSVNNQVPVSSPIAPSVTMDKKQFRWCYRGEGTDNACKVLVDDISYTGSTGAAPTIAVTSNGVPVAAAQIITVPRNTSLTTLNISITVNDPNGNNTSLNCAILNQTTQGLISGEFSSASIAVPYALTPTTGVFNVAGVTNSFTLTANDGQGNQTLFSFSVAVPSAGGGGSKDEGGCTTDASEGWALLLLAILAARVAWTSRSKRRA
jgi:hypothetical protein